MERKELITCIRNKQSLRLIRQMLKASEFRQMNPKGKHKQRKKTEPYFDNNIEIAFYAIQRGKHFKKIIVFNLVKMTQYC